MAISTIDAKKYDYKALNIAVRSCGGDCVIDNCLGQRFIASGLDNKKITINGIPGNALGAYLNGAHITVNGNAQDAVGDTMNAGRIVVHGNIGDAAGYAMRNGEIFVRGNAGYRAGIHMKAYKDRFPVMVIGGTAGSFLGEYQAGGVIVVLNMNDSEIPVGNFTGTGMHGGKIFVRGNCEKVVLPEQVSLSEVNDSDMREISGYLKDFGALFDVKTQTILDKSFFVLTPNTQSPYRQMYVQN